MSVLKTALHEALLILTGPDNAKNRLCRAWLDHLAALVPDEMPDGLRDRFMAIRDGLTCQAPVNNEHPVEATIRKMSPHQAARWNQDIVQLYVQLLAEAAPVQLRLVEGTEADDTPADTIPDFLTHH